MSRNKFTNIKISVRLYELLKPYPVFNGDGYKAISACHHLLQRIDRYSYTTDDQWVSISTKPLKNIFYQYNVKITESIDAMKRCNLIEHISGFYDRTGQKQSICAKFKLTALGKSILLDGEMEYLRHLENDVSVRRNVQKTHSRNKIKALKHMSDDSVCNYLSNVLFNVNIDENKLRSLLKKFDAKDKTQAAQKLNITTFSDQIRSGSFDNIKRSQSDGRIHYPIVLIKSEARTMFQVNGKQYLGTLDLRACHPTFFASYLVLLFINKIYNDNLLKFAFSNNASINNLIESTNTVFSSNSFDSSYFLSTTNLYNLPLPSSTTPQYLVGFADKLAEEYKKWNLQWTHPDIDPRDIICAEVGYPSRKLAKKSLVSAINGSKNKVYNWISQNYPTLFLIWQCTNKKQTGNHISRIYETTIILNQKVIDAATDLNLVIVPEHDGYGIFADPSDSEIENKAKTIEAMIQEHCLHQFGIRPVMKFKREVVCI